MASALAITVGGTALPGDVVSLKRSDELLWSEGTGRAASTGQMAGSVVAQKQTWAIEWGPITQAQYDAIKAACGAGFKQLVIKLNGTTVANVSAYRGNIAGSLLGVFGGVAYYAGVSVELIER